MFNPPEAPMMDKLTEYARKLRKEMTKEERHLWYDFLRGYPVRFLRQRPIDRYIVDFYCAGAGLVIELDGGQHFDSPGLAADRERDAVLERYGLTVLRIPNNEINRNFSGVCAYIDREVKKRSGEIAGNPVFD